MRCPYCGEEVRHEAVVCRYCQRDFTAFLPILRDVSQLRRDVASLRDIVRVLVENGGTGSVPLITPTPAGNPVVQQTARIPWIRTLALAAIAPVSAWASITLWWNTFDDTLEALLETTGLALPLLAGVLLGWKVAGSHKLLYVVVGAITGVAYFIGDSVSLFGEPDYGALPAMVIGHAFLVVTGGLLGDRIERRASAQRGDNQIARAISHTLLHVPAATDTPRTKKLAETITALAPLLTFIASLFTGYLTYLGTQERAARTAERNAAPATSSAYERAGPLTLGVPDSLSEPAIGETHFVRFRVDPPSR